MTGGQGLELDWAPQGSASEVLPDTLTLGVEEEYLIIDRATRRLVSRAKALRADAEERLGTLVEGELNLCQIEVASPICRSLDEVRLSLTGLRRGLHEAAGPESDVIAVGSHPMGSWEHQHVDHGVERYRNMEDDFQVVARQQVICGCHVHVGVADPDLAAATTSRLRRWLPGLLALSANSPFWEGRDTGYQSFRLQVWQNWPTLGMPPRLGSAAELEAILAQLRAVDAIETPASLYWYVRPSHRYPTIECRPFDVCMSVDHAVTLAGLTRALTWVAMQEALAGVPEPDPPREVLDAAMWRAARFGIESSLVSIDEMTTRPAEEVVTAMLRDAQPGLEAHGDGEVVADGIWAILRDGNGALVQRRAFADSGRLDGIVDDAVRRFVP